MDATRTVRLWLANDEGLYFATQDMARAADNVYDLSVSLQAFVDDLMPELPAGIASDLLTHALGEVEWQDLASELLEDDAA